MPVIPPSFAVYLWRDKHNLAIVSTSDRMFAKELQKWARGEGYRVTFSKNAPRTCDDCPFNEQDEPKKT